MFDFTNAKTIEQFTKNPFAAFGKVFDLQRQAFVALGEMIENNSRAMVKMANVRDPQTLLSAPQGILKEVLEQNLAVMTRVGEAWSAEIRGVVAETAKAELVSAKGA